MTLRLELLGTPRIDVDGAPLAVDTRKATALLAFLAVSGSRQSRDTLVDLLWPDLDAARGRAALRRTLSTLRTALDRRWLEASRTAIELELEADAVDVARFRQLARGAADGPAGVPALEQAVALHRGDLMAGFGLRDSAAFDDWQRAAAIELRSELEVTLDRLVDGLAAAGRIPQAVAHAQRRLALDPLHEPAHRALILLYAAAGRRAEALTQYRECVRALDRELGVRPLPETSMLYVAVNAGEPVAWPVPAPQQPAPRHEHAARPLVGRGHETRELMAELDAARAQGRLVVLEGEPGVGKTRLAESLAGEVRAGGGGVLEYRCHEGEAGLPFGLVAGLLGAAMEAAGADAASAVPEHWRAEAARVQPGLSAAPPLADGLGALQRMHEGIAQVLWALLEAVPVSLLSIDDLHLADPASLELLGYLGRRLSDHRLLVLVAWRPEEIGRDHAGLRRQAVRSIRLGRLTREDVAQLARSAGLDEHAGRLFDETEGLPLFVVEYLDVLGRSDEPGELPSGVRELLGARLDAVGEPASQLLTAAAVIGRSFDADILREASGRGEEETVTGLEELTRRGLVVEREAAYDFSHDKLLGLAYERTSLARRRLLHRRVAEALRARHREPSVIARHLQLAGLDGAAADAYREAGDRARTLHAYLEALDGYRSALALGHDAPAPLHEAIGDLHTLRGEYRAAIAAFEAAASLASDDQLARIEHKLGRVHDRRGDRELAELHLQAALRLGGESARVEADRSLLAHRRGDDPEAGRLAARALALAEADGDVEAVAQSENILGMLTGDRTHLERSVELSESLVDRSVLVAALNNLALACNRAGERERAIELTQRALELCSRQGDRHREAALMNNLADLYHQAGRADESMRQLKQAVAIFAEIGAGEGGMQPEVWKLVEW